MNIMVIGGGGREHAIIKKLKENPEITRIFALPGNGGILGDAECVDIGVKDIGGICAFARANEIDFAVVSQDDPLALGAVDALMALGIPCFGPDQKAAAIESSKVFAKNLMKKYGIPTAAYEVFDDIRALCAYLSTCAYPVVLKADGLALGKGVIIAENEREAVQAANAMMIDKRFGESGSRVVVEEYLTGPEVSVLAFTDGEAIAPMVSSMDHKRAMDGDKGLNTGGMGAIAPNPYYSDKIAEVCMRDIYLPTVRAMNAEGRPFKGCLYFGLMLTKNGPKVIEYNCRFGDPEAQTVLALLKTDLLTIMRATANGTLKDISIEWQSGYSCCVMVASAGYPEAYEKGKPLSLGRAEALARVYHSGTKRVHGAYVTNGGRVLGVCATGDTLALAVARAYEAAREIRFEGAFMRNDIGAHALACIEDGGN